MNAGLRNLQTIAFLLIALGLIALALAGYLTSFSRALLTPFIELQAWVYSRYQVARDLLSAPQDIVQLQQRNLQLEAQVSQLQAQIIELQQQLAEARILSALVDFARANPENRYQAAAVIGRDPSPFLRYIIINRGSDDNIRRGMPVVTQQGLVGRIDAVTANAARVQLITDSAAVVNAKIQPSGAQAVLKGQITGDLLLEMIPQGAPIEVGNLVLTSGLGGGYPPNIVIGQISGIRSQPQDIFQSATVQSVVDFSQLEIVLVIVNFRPVNIEPLIPQEGQP
ncbi:MAG: rod shape-determining protein MreC [Anaerolineales bacterium]|nr:rod shape-determining protein MreC [Anaerolineales bacterium]MCS7248106.1 rod shape-determining protein MreC [Anaerolineales bacterium]MDW8161918.1 rod shape-determining protein MreC [Anaerolineales bacterium]MDW8446398.1 rod shape-determining protein MreC [Anaerolineales bacterium]